MEDKNIDVYRELQKHLNKMPIGFPATESGIELRVLKHLFTPEQAQLAIKLSYRPEPLKRIHRKIKKRGISIELLEEKLDEMYNKGIINFGINKEGDKEEKFYANAPLVIGMFEFQLNHLTKEFVNDVKQYFEESFWENEFNKTKIPQLRTIPIEQAIEREQSVATYDDLRSIIENVGGTIAVQECICRQGKDLLGEPCKRIKRRDVCFSFRRGAEGYIDKGLAREVSKEEALEILEEVEQAGLVIQPGNSQRPMCICCCCGCCCEVLTNQKRFTEPAQFFATNFYAEVDPDLCVGCGTCEERCNMDAIHVEDNISYVDKTRCIGCGVCVPTCTAEAIKLHKKEEEIVPPKNTAATYMAIMDKKAELARAEKL